MGATQNVLPVAVEANITEITALLAGEDVQANRLVVEGGCTWVYNNTTNDTNVITPAMIAANGSGYVDKLIIGNPVNGATVALYDGTNTAGTLCLSVTVNAASMQPFAIPLGVRVTNGLALKASANSAVTVVYR